MPAFVVAGAGMAAAGGSGGGGGSGGSGGVDGGRCSEGEGDGAAVVVEGEGGACGGAASGMASMLNGFAFSQFEFR